MAELTQDYCQRVKCGVIPQNQVSDMDLYNCSVLYGAGALFPCHADCVQYGKCVRPSTPLPLPISGKATQEALVVYDKWPGQPPIVPHITPENIVQPAPDILTIIYPMVEPCGPSWCECGGWWGELNASVNANPLIALAVLAGVVYLVAKRGNL